MFNRYKNPEEKRAIVREFIKNNPNCTHKDIKKATKIKLERIYSNMKEAFKNAGVSLTKNLTKRNRKEQIRDVIKFIKENPGCTVTDVYNKTGVTVQRVFGSILRAYELAGVEYPKREIKDGIRNPIVVKRCRDFEKETIKRLQRIGRVIPKFRLIDGKVIDAVLKINKKMYVVEIKDFRSRNNITMSQIKQVLNYMGSLNCKNGVIICPEESLPKRKNGRNIYIDNFSIKIMSVEDLGGIG